jgi:DNA-binding FadR family transcriptional regulator
MNVSADATGAPVPAYERLATSIRDRIMSGELNPGDQLPTESQLCAQYNVSRSTARESLRTLASQGLLKIKRGVSGGTFVAVPTSDQISGSLWTGLTLLTESAHVSMAALVEVREMLEVPAAEVAALRHTDDELAAIRDSLFDPRTVTTAPRFEITRDFHTQVLAATHNPLLELVAAPVFRILQKRLLRDQASTDFWGQVDFDHREILSYLEARDQAGAREAARAHLRYLRGHYEQLDRDRTGGSHAGVASDRTDL